MKGFLGKSLSVLAILVLLTFTTAARAEPVTINFDRDAFGNPINAPALFAETSPLTTLYASLGVTFSGPGPGLGGAILNDSSFGTPARSGRNILAFNPDAGYPMFPETLLFRDLVSNVSIYASGSFDVDTFVMQAFDDAGALVGTASVSTRPFALLEINHEPGIRRVVITRTGGTGGSEFDDLSFTPIPEPTALVLFLTGAVPGTLFYLRRRRTKGPSSDPIAA